MDADLLLLFFRESIKNAIINGNEILEQLTRWIDFQWKSSFGKIELNNIGAMF